MTISSRMILVAAAAGLLALGACSKANGPSGAQMSAAIEKSAQTLGGHINDPDIQSAVGQCKAGSAQVTDGSGQTISCADFCGTTAAGKCDFTVKVADLKKQKCTELKDKPGIYECAFTMTISSPNKWLNLMLTQANEGSNTAANPLTTRFKKDGGTWVVADGG